MSGHAGMIPGTREAVLTLRWFSRPTKNFSDGSLAGLLQLGIAWVCVVLTLSSRRCPAKEAPYAVSTGTTAAVDPVQQIAFSLYNDQLFRLVIDNKAAFVP